METENVFSSLRSSPPKSAEVEANPATPKDETVYRPECNSPDPSCAICLGKLENKSFTDSCFHQFCFTCLLEWSKVKAECPLCKQSFKSIIHNVRSIEDYDQYHLRAAEEPPRSWESPDGFRFRYRSTLTSERRREMALERRLLGHVSRSACIYRSLRNHRPSAVTTDFRRTVYEHNWWVQPMELTRYRDVSPQFYRSNPACTHRLIPWLNRELVVLLHEHESRISFVLELVLSLIQRYEILSPEFREHVRPYIFGRTEHFIHEFYNYARCPWDMRAYDQRAVYRDLQVPRFSSDSNDSDIMIVDTPTSSVPGNEQSRSSQPTTLIEQSNSATTSQEPSDPTTSTSDSHNPEPSSAVSALDRVKTFLSNVGRTGWESPSTSAPAWESPTRGGSSYGNLPNLISIPFLSSSPQPGPSGMTQFLQPIRDDSDSSSSDLLSSTVRVPFPERASGSRVPKGGEEEDCFIVACVKPARERTPVVVDLVTDSDDDSVMHVKNEPQEKDRRSRLSRLRRARSSSSSSSVLTPSTSRSPSRSHVGSSSRSRTGDHDELSSHSSLPNDSKSLKRLPPPSHTYVPNPGSRSSSPSPDRWRWTAYENGGGKLQRSYSRSSSGEPVPRLPSVVGEVHGMLAKRKKHKKHKHKHKSHHHRHHHDSRHKFKKHCKGHKNSSSKSHH